MAIESQYRHTLVVKHQAELAEGPETGGGLDTTLAADAPAGSVDLELADVGTAAPGDLLRVGDEGETEVLEVAVIDGTMVTFTEPTGLAHDTGDQVRAVDAGAAGIDEYGQPLTAPATLATVPGLIQPRGAREVAQSASSGAAIGDHVGYMALLEGLDASCWIEHDGIRFDIVSIADAAGIGHHFELGLRRVA